MYAPKDSKLPRKNIRIYTDKYLVRTIKPDDASERWANWLSDPELIYMMNMPARNWTKLDVVKYIGRFDQRQRLLLGIFERNTWVHIGILTAEIRHGGQLVGNMFIGEPRYRKKGVTTEITPPCRDYFFDALDVKILRATVLARNHVMTRFLLKTGFTLDQTVKNHVKSNSDGSMLDLSMLSLTREAWHQWKMENLPHKRADENAR
jgi:RimJ/RimL family protein N-acetyltransferase